MRTTTEYNNIIKLDSDGLNHCEISRQLNIPRSTIRDYLKSYKNNTLIINPISKNPHLVSYNFIFNDCNYTLY